MSHIKLMETALEERPRERLLHLGRSALTNRELLAIILRSGTQSESVLELSGRILKVFENNLTRLSRATLEELMQIHGVGLAKACEITAALTLAERLVASANPLSTIINTPADLAPLLIERMRPLMQEEFHVVLLDTKNRVIKDHLVTKGVLDQSNLHAREVFRTAIHLSCHKLIMAHNHPSGDATPSPADIEATQSLVECGKLLGIQVIDHLVIGTPSTRNPDGYCSLRSEGYI